MDEEQLKKTDLFKANSQVSKMLAENKTLQDNIAAQLNLMKVARPSSFVMRESLHQSEPPVPFPVIQNPAVKTNELLGQLVHQNKEFVVEISQQRELLISLNKTVALLAEGLHVVSDDVQTLIRRVSGEPGSEPNLGDEAGCT